MDPENSVSPVHGAKRIVTQKDIARELGISLITVQRALNNSGYVSKEVRERIAGYIKENDYRPHRGASSLAKGSRELIGIFSTREPESFWKEIRRGIAAASKQIEYLGFQVEYYQIPYGDTPAYKDALMSMIGRNASAVAVVNNHEFDMSSIFSILDGSKIPYATFNIDAPESKRLYYVGPDYYREGRIGGNILDRCIPGGGSIAYLYWKSKIPNQLAGADINEERKRGLDDYCAECGRLALHTIPLRKDGPNRRLFSAGDQETLEVLKSAKGLFVPHFEKRHFQELFGLLPKRIPILTSLYSNFTVEMLQDDSLAGIVFQDPVMQGALTVKTLENFILQGQKSKVSDFPIVPQVMIKENIGLSDNHMKLFSEE